MSDCNIVMVGDFKQSIYGFRGSDPDIINSFTEEYKPNVEIMSYNFRSAPEIVENANIMADTIDLGNDSLNDSKVSHAAQTHLHGDVSKIYDIDDFLAELKLIETPLHETCILARTNQAIKGLAKILGKLQIPYYLHTEYDILKRAEVKVFMNMLSLVSHGYNKSLAISIITALKGGVPLKISASINKCGSMNDIGNMFGNIKKIPEMVNAFNDLEVGSFNKAIPKIAKMLETPKKKADQIEQSLTRFHRDLKEVKVREELNDWMAALDELLFEAQFLEEKSANKVQLMTVHKSKGLQWTSVMFIYNFSILELESHIFYDVVEERRVVYTAITRPKQNLVTWNLSEEQIKYLLNTGGLERKIDEGLKKGEISIHEFNKY